MAHLARNNPGRSKQTEAIQRHLQQTELLARSLGALFNNLLKFMAYVLWGSYARGQWILAFPVGSFVVGERITEITLGVLTQWSQSVLRIDLVGCGFFMPGSHLTNLCGCLKCHLWSRPHIPLWVFRSANGFVAFCPTIRGVSTKNILLQFQLRYIA